jgi:hydrogenase/urease accessory protein HupE
MSNCFFKLTRVGMLLGILTILSGTTWAHDPGLSSVEVRVLEDRIVAEVSFAPLDLQTVPTSGPDLLTLENKQGQLELLSFSRKSSDQNSVHFLLEFTHSSAAEVRVSSPVLAHLPRGHKQFCSVYDKDNRVLAERMLSADAKDFTVDLRTRSTNNQSLLSFVRLGIEHIVTGYDHLAFLLALLLAGGSLQSNAKTITSFTVAHSLTLALATFGLLNIPPAVVEPVIAASVVFVGVENLSGRRLASRWLVTFVFGLVHGLGFASILREMGIGGTEAGVAIPLLSFNLGVELAQLAIAAFVLPFVRRLEQRPTFTLRYAPALSLLITIAGLYWFLIRTLV